MVGTRRIRCDKVNGRHETHATVFLAPAVKGLFGDAKLFDRLGNGFTLALQDLGFAQFADDRFRGLSFSGHGPVLLSVSNTNLNPGPVFSG
jgi:hypothetical protein